MTVAVEDALPVPIISVPVITGVFVMVDETVNEFIEVEVVVGELVRLEKDVAEGRGVSVVNIEGVISRLFDCIEVDDIESVVLIVLLDNIDNEVHDVDVGEME